MKQDKWTQQLHDKLAEHETAAPDNLWADIESAISQQQHRARFIALRRWGVAAAAVVAVMIVSVIGIRLFQNEETGMSNGQQELLAETTKTEQPVKPAKETADQPQPTAPLITKTHKQPAVRKQQPEQPTNEPIPVQASDETQETQTVTESISPDSSRNTDVTTPYMPPKTTTPLHPLVAQEHPIKHSVSFSLYAMNAFGANDNSNSVLMADALARSYTDIFANDISYNEHPQNPIYLTDYEEHHHHYQPVALGVSIAYPLNQRLSLTSGIVYTKLHSDFTQTIHSQHIQQDQELHYIGVPLGLCCRTWQYGNFRTYVTAGMQADWNVSAKQSTEGVEQKLNHDKMQWSVNASLGLQYDVLPLLALYAEPGINYHFDNGSTVKNYFKDKPVNLKLQFGVRLKLGSDN